MGTNQLGNVVCYVHKKGALQVVTQFLSLHESAEFEIIQMSLLPVLSNNDNFWAGVPTSTVA